MADVNANINIGVDTSIGIAEIKQLQRQIAQLNAQLLKSGAQQIRSADQIQRNLINNINSTGKFAANVRTISTTTEGFTNALERNKLSMGQYFKYAGASTKTFGRLFKSEFDTIEKVARERVKTLQTQFVKLGRDGSGAMKAIAVRPLALDMENLATKTAMAAQKQQLMNQLLKQGSTNLLNFGKNTQWAGRQLMVGFTVPLAYLGTIASKTFMKMEEQAIRFKRVYGDTFTATAETDKMIEQVKQLASEFTKYGIAVEKTMKMAADAAAMGKQGAELIAQVRQASTLAVLGGVEQDKALETAISLTNAFGIAAEDLAGKIDFLNAVENQTVTSIEDLTIAIPKAAPVIKQLGGDVQDLAFFLTAMKEGGINASEGANALKSGLASIINPTEKASKFLQSFGINLKGMVEANKGDVKGLVLDFAEALDTLDPLSKSRAIEQLFGKFQFARLSTLFQNVIAEGSQAERVLKLSATSAEELAILSEREMKRIQESPMYKFKAAVEDLKVSLVPLGEAFLKAVTPLVEFAKGFLDKFNGMSEGAKQFTVIATTAIAGLGPILLMTFGLIANGVANLIKLFSTISNVFRNTGKTSMDLGSQTEYMTQQQLEAAAIASSLDQKHAKLIQTFTSEAGAVNQLASAYVRAQIAQSKLLSVDPRTGMPLPTARKAKPKKYANGVISVPGPKGAGDIVPAMLSPGEAVIPAKQSQKYAGLISGMINDEIPGFRFGLNPFAAMLSRSRVAVRTKRSDLEAMLQAGKGGRYKSAFETGTGADYISTAGLANPAQARLRSQMEEKMFGLGPNTPASQRPTYGYARTSPFQALLNRIFGFRGRQYNAITSGFSIGDRGQAFGYKNPKTGMFGPTPNYQKDVLQRYGDIDLITKRSVARRSSGAVTDALMDYSRSSSVPGLFKLSPVSLSGKGNNDYNKAKFDRLNNPFGSYKSDPVNYPNQFTSNPKPPYVETYTPGGFSVKEISKIVAKDRSTAREIQRMVDQAGLRIRVTPQNAPMAIKMLANMFGTRFEDGIASVPKPTSLSFNQDMTLQAAHLSPAALNADGTENFTKEEAIKKLNSEYRKGLSAGLFKDTPVMRKNLNDAIAKIASSKSTRFRLYGNTVGLMTTSLNQAWANKAGVISAEEALKKLQLQPMGMLAGSQVKSAMEVADRLKLDGYKVPDNQIKSYSLAVETNLRERLQAMGKTMITEDEFHSMYNSASKSGLAAIKSKDVKASLGRIKDLSALAFSVGFPGKDSVSGFTRPANMSVLRTKVQELARTSRASLPKIFGDDYSDTLLDKTKIQGISREEKKAAQALLKGAGADKKKYFELATRMADARAKGRNELRAVLGLSQIDSQAAKTTDPVVKKEPAQPKKITTPAKNKPAQAIAKQTVKNAKQQAILNIRDFIWGAKKYNSGVVSVPGPKGKGDVVPAMLTPGEAVIPAPMADKYAPLINSMISGSVPGYKGGKFAKEQQQVTQADVALLKKQLKGNPFRRALNNITTAITGAVAEGVNAARVGKVLAKDRVSTYKTRFAEETAITNAQMAKRDERLRRQAEDKREKRLAAQQERRQSQSAKREDRFNKKYQAANLKMVGNRFKDVQTGKFVSKADAASRMKDVNAQRRAAMTGKIGGAGSVAGMAAMAYGMSGGPGAEIASMASLPLMMLPAILPMLTNPIGIAAVAIAGLAGAAFFLNEQFKKTRDEAAGLAISLGSGTKTLKPIAEFAGKATATEVMTRRRQSQFAPISQQVQDYGDIFAQSEAGKSMLTSLQNATKAGGRTMAGSSLLGQLSTSVSSGILTSGEAVAIAQAMGRQLGDAKLGMDVTAKIVETFGPNGENLKNKPLEVRMKLLSETGQPLQAFMQGIVSGAPGVAQGLSIGGATYVAPSNPQYSGTSATVTVAGTDGPPDPTKTLSSGQVGQFVGQTITTLQTQREIVASSDLYYDNLIASAKARYEETKSAEDLKKLNDLIAKKDSDRVALLARAKQTNDQIVAGYKAASAASKDSIIGGFKAQAEILYKDSPFLETAKETIDKLDNLDLGGNEVVLAATVASGDIPADVMSSFLSGSTAPIQKDVSLIIQSQGSQTGLETIQLMNQYPGNETIQKNIQFRVQEGNIDILNQLNMLPDKGAFEFFVSSPVSLKTLSKTFDEIDKLATDGKLNAKSVIEQEIITNPTALAEFKENQAYFDSLPAASKKVYLQSFIATYTSLDKEDVNAFIDEQVRNAGSLGGRYVKEMYSGSEGFLKAKGDLAAKQTKAITDALAAAGDTTVGGTTTGGGDGGGAAQPADTTISDLAASLRMFGNAAISTKAKLSELGKAMLNFNGISQQLRRKGMGSAFIDSVMAMDQKTRDKFVIIKNGVVTVTEAGKTLQKQFSRDLMGKFNDAQVEGAINAQNQTAALRRLQNGGLSLADALEVVQDNEIANAIATGATTAEIERQIAAIKERKAAELKFQLATPTGMRQFISEFVGKVDEGTGAVGEFFAAQERLANAKFDAATAGLRQDVRGAQQEIQGYKDTIDDLEFLLVGIQDKEDVINEKYDKRAEALDKIWKANSDIAKQQQDQLNVVSALASGDLAAAAEAMRQAQAARAEKAREDQQRMLEIAREKELSNVTATGGKTRKQIEDDIKKTNDEILKIEEQKLEPAEKLIRVQEKIRDDALAAIAKTGYLNQTKEGWALIAAEAANAAVQSNEFKKSLEDTLKLIPGLTIAAGVVSFDPAKFSQAMTGEITTAQNTDVAGAGDVPPVVNPNQAKIDELNRLMAISRYRVREENLAASVDQALIKLNIARAAEIRALGGTPDMTTIIKPTGANYNMGGMVAKRFATGGFAMGTDIVPAMLTPGEFVVRKYAVENFGADNLKAVNNGTFKGDSMYNYEVNVNVKSDANPDQIARAVMTQIKQIDSQRIRSNRY